MKSSNPITVLLADDSAFVRRNLCGLLKADGHFTVVGEAKNGREAVAMAAAVKADIVLMDISMPQLNGLEATRRILAANPLAKVIVLSAYDDEEYLERARAVGAAGFLAKQRASESLAKTIREIALGRSFFHSAEGRRAPPGTKKLWGGREPFKGALEVGFVEPMVRLKII